MRQQERFRDSKEEKNGCSFRAERYLLGMLSSWSLLLRNSLVTPNQQGIQAVGQAMGVIGVSTSACWAAGLTDSFLDSNDVKHTNLSSLGGTFLRSLFVPALLEESLWRVLLQPPSLSWIHVAIVNGGFGLYHIVLGSTTVAKVLDGRMGATVVFRDPTFVFLAVVMGNACSWAYQKAGHALWAPVLVHTVTVTLWLAALGGERALSTEGGLQPAERKKGKSK